MGLPQTGRDIESIRADMDARQQGDADWEAGRTWSLVYSAGEEVNDLRDEAHRQFASENALNPLAFPSVLSFENEIVRMVGDMLNGPDSVGNVTSGGTESILCSVYAARERAQDVHDITDPTMVICETAHPAWGKAAHYLGLETVRTPAREDWRADPEAMAGAISDRTALVVVSAPSYPHGVVDPVEAVAAIADEAGVPCHVDACIGGFVLPFLPDIGYDTPDFDFSVDGVTSVSVDPHKYGYTAKGVSALLYRGKDLRRYQYYASDHWPGGVYVAPNVQGTRPAGPMAAAWAVMNFIGRDGYQELVAEAMTATEEIQDHIAEMDELAVVSDPDMTLLGVESTLPDTSAWTVQRELSDRGWEIERQQRPESMHLSVMATHAAVTDDFLADLDEAVDVARDTERAATAPLYGMSGAVDDDEELTEAVVDMLNNVFV